MNNTRKYKSKFVSSPTKTFYSLIASVPNDVNLSRWHIAYLALFSKQPRIKAKILALISLVTLMVKEILENTLRPEKQSPVIVKSAYCCCGVKTPAIKSVFFG